MIWNKELNKKKIFLQKSFLIFLTFFMLSNSLFAKKKKKSAEESSFGMATATYQNPSENLDSSNISEDSSLIKLPSTKRTYFSKIDSEIISLVEKGSPSSLQEAMSKIRKNESDYTENEKVLIAISTEIMKTVWPSQKITWNSFETKDDNPYIGAIKSAKSGIFDTSTGNTDFFSTILPAFVIFKNSFNPNDYDLCKTATENALSIHQDSVLAIYMMGLIYEKNNELENALNFYKKAYNLDEPAQELSLAYARILQKTGNLELASSIMKKFSSETNSLEILKQNAYISFSNKDYDLAEQYVARVLQQTPNDLEFVLFRVRILVEKKDYIHAVSLLDVYERQNDTNLDYLILRAKVQLDWSKNTNAATETIEKAIELYPDNSEILMIAARISSMTDSPVAGRYADELSEKVLEKEPDNADALEYALKGFSQRKNWKEAYEISSRLVQKENFSSDVAIQHVKICLELGKKSEAYDFSRKLYNENPNDEKLLEAYILAYSQTGNRDSVIKYIDSLMENSSSKVKSFLYFRKSFLEYSEENALSDLRSSLISNPRNSDALFRLYEIYYDKKDYRKAQYYLRQVVAINPNDTSVKKLNEALTKLIQ